MSFKKTGISAASVVVALGLLAGCQSKQDAAIEQAKKMAAATGRPQQVVTVDKNGNTITTTVQPPVPGQTGEVVTTTVSPAPPAGSPNGTFAPNQPAIAGGAAPAGQPAYAGNAAPQQAYAGNGAAPQMRNDGPPVRPAELDVPAGTNLAIRINQHISVKTSRPGDPFDGEVVEPVLGSNNQIVIEKGTPVGGVVDVAHKRGHFKGASLLELRLTSLTLNGTRYPLQTRDFSESKRGKGRRSAALIGGGTGLGMLIGGIASGGTGLLIGGLAGAGAGTGVAGLTGNGDLNIPSESIVHFRLADDLVLQR